MWWKYKSLMQLSSALTYMVNVLVRRCVNQMVCNTYFLVSSDHISIPLGFCQHFSRGSMSAYFNSNETTVVNNSNTIVLLLPSVLYFQQMKKECWHPGSRVDRWLDHSVPTHNDNKPSIPISNLPEFCGTDHFVAPSKSHSCQLYCPTIAEGVTKYIAIITKFMVANCRGELVGNQC